MIQVYKAELDNMQTVAVKFLAGRDLPTMKNFAAEVEMMRACRCEQVCSFYGAWLAHVCPPWDLRCCLPVTMLVSVHRQHAAEVETPVSSQ